MDKQEKIARYHELNQAVKPGSVLFAGSSLMEMFPIEQFVQQMQLPITVYNRGISGFIIPQLDAALEACVLELKPARLFINIGTNDLTDASQTIEQVVAAYRALLLRIRAALPACEIITMAYYPINFQAAPDWMKPALMVRTNEKLCEANRQVQQMAQELGIRYVDVNRALKDECGRLKAEYTTEGMHIKPEGYRAILPDLLPLLKEA